MLTAETLYHRGVDHSNAGRHATARRVLDSAARRDPSPDVAALIAGTVAYLDSERGDAESALEICQAALADHRIGAHTRAQLIGQVGLIQLRRGEYEAALGSLTAAIARLADLPDRLGRSLLNRGLVRVHRSELAAAQRDFAAAAEAFRRSDEPIEQAKALHNQGYAALLAGDLLAAIRCMDEARPVFAELSPVALATSDADRAAVLLAAGQTAEAVRLLTDVSGVYGARGLRQAQAEAELVLAKALAADDPLRASSVARRAAQRFRRRGSETWALRADAVAAGLAIAGGRRGQAVHAEAEGLGRELRRAGLGVEALELRLHTARALVTAGRSDDARNSLAGVRVRSRASITTRLLAEEVRAEAALADHRGPAALRRAAYGLDVLQDWQSSFGSLELQNGLAVHGRRLAVTGIRAALRSGRPDTVFEWSERVRALSTRVGGLRPPADSETAGLLAELRTLRASEPAPRSSAARREAELRESIRRRRWSDEGERGFRTRVSLESVRAAAADDSAVLVAHLWSEDRLDAVVVDGDGARIVELGPWAPVAAVLRGLHADLDMAAATLPAAMHRAVTRSLAARIVRLDQLVLAPLDLPDAERVVLTPAGMLAGVPWGMLPSLDNRPVAVPESATRWLADSATSRTLRTAGFAAGPGVDRAEHEVRSAAALWGAAEPLVGREAGSAAVSRLAERVDLLHVAAHGRHSADNPLFSGFELADGPWFGYDIDQLRRVPSVVVLSACELGRSASQWGLEALGMSRAWLHAGARTVVASAAAVNDADADELLSAAHVHLAAGVAPSDALAAATRSTGIAPPFVVRGSGW